MDGRRVDKVLATPLPPASDGAEEGGGAAPEGRQGRQ